MTKCTPALSVPFCPTAFPPPKTGGHATRGGTQHPLLRAAVPANPWAQSRGYDRTPQVCPARRTPFAAGPMRCDGVGLYTPPPHVPLWEAPSNTVQGPTARVGGGGGGGGHCTCRWGGGGHCTCRGGGGGYYHVLPSLTPLLDWTRQNISSWGTSPGGRGHLLFQSSANSVLNRQMDPAAVAQRWSVTYRCTTAAPLPCSVDCPQASSRLIFVTEQYLWSYRPLTSQICFCVFVLFASCAPVQ